MTSKKKTRQEIEEEIMKDAKAIWESMPVDTNAGNQKVEYKQLENGWGLLTWKDLN